MLHGDDTPSAPDSPNLVVTLCVPILVRTLHNLVGRISWFVVQLDGLYDLGLDVTGVGEEEVLAEADEESISGDLNRIVDRTGPGNSGEHAALVVGGVNVEAWERETEEGVDDGEANRSSETDLSACEESQPWFWLAMSLI